MSSNVQLARHQTADRINPNIGPNNSPQNAGSVSSSYKNQTADAASSHRIPQYKLVTGDNGGFLMSILCIHNYQFYMVFICMYMLALPDPEAKAQTM